VIAENDCNSDKSARSFKQAPFHGHVIAVHTHGLEAAATTHHLANPLGKSLMFNRPNHPSSIRNILRIEVRGNFSTGKNAADGYTFFFGVMHAIGVYRGAWGCLTYVEYIRRFGFHGLSC
jgi:hypothetical protein